jgi:hypothetical protein
MNTLGSQGKCQYCGNPLKASIWKRKLRRWEAYGVVLVMLGLATIQVVRWAGTLLFLMGIGMIAFSFFRPRLR